MVGTKAETVGALCLVTAADIEFNTVAKLLTAGTPAIENGLQVLRGRYGLRKVTLLKTEIGAIGFAEKLRAHLVLHQYEALIVLGLAGALDPKLRTGDVVLYDHCLDGRAICSPEGKSNEAFCHAELSQRLFEMFKRQGLPCERRHGISVSRVVIEAQHKLALYSQTKAGAVDMETYCVLVAVDDLKLPSVAVRVVMDEAASDLPDFNAGLDATGHVRLWPTLQALTASPRATLTFLLTLRPALRNLARLTRAVLAGLNSR